MLLLAGAAILLWPAILNRGPFFFTDTTAYVRGADTAVFKATGLKTAWTDQVAGTADRTSNTDQATGTVELTQDKKVILSGRSIYYGLLLYLSYIAGSFWVAIAIQAFIAALLLKLLMDAFLPTGIDGPKRHAIHLAIYAAGAFLTPLAFYACFLMPDIFAGFFIAAVTIVCTRSRLSASTYVFLTLLLCAATLAHSANLLMVLLGIPMIAMARLIRVPVAARSFAILPFVAVIGFAGEYAFNRAVIAATGQPPLRPPFVMARVIELGPGMRYLQDYCPDKKIEMICSFLPRLPMDNMAFLWAPEPDKGVFSILEPARQRQLEAEQTPMIVGMLIRRPFDMMLTAIPATASMLTNLALDEFNYQSERQSAFASKIPASVAHQVRGRPDFVDTFPVRQLHSLIYATFFASLLAAAILLLYGVSRRNEARDDAAVGLAIALAFLLLNAAIASSLSGDYARYNTRAIWILPVLVTILIMSMYYSSERLRTNSQVEPPRETGSE